MADPVEGRLDRLKFVTLSHAPNDSIMGNRPDIGLYCWVGLQPISGRLYINPYIFKELGHFIRKGLLLSIAEFGLRTFACYLRLVAINQLL